MTKPKSSRKRNTKKSNAAKRRKVPKGRSATTKNTQLVSRIATTLKRERRKEIAARKKRNVDTKRRKRKPRQSAPRKKPQPKKKKKKKKTWRKKQSTKLNFTAVQYQHLRIGKLLRADGFVNEGKTERYYPDATRNVAIEMGHTPGQPNIYVYGLGVDVGLYLQAKSPQDDVIAHKLEAQGVRCLGCVGYTDNEIVLRVKQIMEGMDGKGGSL